MTLFQIIMVCFMSVGFLVTLGFAVAFVVEAVKSNKVSVSAQEPVNEVKEEEEEYDIRQMLAQLEQESDSEEEKQEATVEPVVEVVNATEEEIVEEQPAEEVKEELVAKEEPKEEKVASEEVVEQTEETEEDKTPKTVIIKEVTTETVGTDFDYNVRLAKIVESKNKMEKDLQKTKNAILKYERTQRRRARNQKMLDRRAVELTNLNLMMYSVTDIKNVDADKKVKQEELTRHIAELKASIQDADEFLAKNREKYEHDKKMMAFYTKEEERYNDEIKELEILIKNANSITGSTTTTTTTTTTETEE